MQDLISHPDRMFQSKLGPCVILDQNLQPWIVREPPAFVGPLQSASELPEAPVWKPLAYMLGRQTYSMVRARAEAFAGRTLVFQYARQTGKTMSIINLTQQALDYLSLSKRKFWAKYSERPAKLISLSPSKFRRRTH